MKKRAILVSRVRRHAALCSAAILVSACGGSADTTGDQQPMLSAQTIAGRAGVAAGAASGPAPATAPGVAETSDANVMAAVEPAPAVSAAPAPVLHDAVPGATYPAAGNSSDTPNASTATSVAAVELSGYQSSAAAPAADTVQAPR